MIPAEIAKALRCTATVQTGDEPCESCPFYRMPALMKDLPDELKAQLNREEWKSCDIDGVAFAAADLIERMEKEKAALIDAASPRKLCGICKHDSWCADHGCNGNLCEECSCYSACPCSNCLSSQKWEWKGLVENK